MRMFVALKILDHRAFQPISIYDIGEVVGEDKERGRMMDAKFLLHDLHRRAANRPPFV